MKRQDHGTVDAQRRQGIHLVTQGGDAGRRKIGLAPDAVHRQSERFDRYEVALERLASEGRAYPAYETAQELELKRKVALGRGRKSINEKHRALRAAN